MKIKDYRESNNKSFDWDVTNKKRYLLKDIRLKHPTLKNHYKLLYPHHTEVNKKFREIYNGKCAYCGVSVNILSADLFEIDHFICKKYFKKNLNKGNHLDNLVFACRDCNRFKSDNYFNHKNSKMFNVDDGSICKCFYRDELYNIRIKKDFKNNDTVNNFYITMRFDSQIRRLNYLLDSMNDFYNEYSEVLDGTKFLECIKKLDDKRKLY